MLWSPRVSGGTVSYVTNTLRPMICELLANMISSALIADCNEFLVDQMTSDMDWPLLPTLVTSDREMGQGWGHSETLRHQISGWIRGAAALQSIVTQARAPPQ